MENEQKLFNLANEIRESGDWELAAQAYILAFNSLTKKVNALKAKIEEREEKKLRE